MKVKALPFPVSSIEFDKVYRVMDKRKSSGYSDRDLSFLLGYRALYVRDVENPLHTLRYTVKDTNYLLDIFDCKLPEIMAGRIPELFYQVKVVENVGQDGSIMYEIYIELPNKEFELYRKFTTREKEELLDKTNTITLKEVSGCIDKLFEGVYFNKPKTALEVFKRCVTELESSIEPSAVADAISHYTGKRKAPRLIQEKNKSARTVYSKE